MCDRHDPIPIETPDGQRAGAALARGAAHALAVAPLVAGELDPFSRIAADFTAARPALADEPRDEAPCLLAPARLPQAPAPRRKLWELDGGVHCAVVGTCLTLRELRQLMRKAELGIEPGATDYHIHRAFVGITRKPSRAARLVQKLLDQKYRQTIRDCSRLESAAELERLWEQALREGVVAGMFWALLTHPHAPFELIDRIYGDVHMLSHLSGAAVRIDLQELARAKRRLSDLETAKSQADELLRRQQKQNELKLRMLGERVQELQSELLRRTEELERLSVHIDKEHAEQLSALNQDLLAQLARGLRRLETSQDESAKWQRIAQRATDHAQVLEARLAETRAERDALESALQPLLTASNETLDAACLGAKCEHRDLCGRCILYVGGRAGQCAHFRDLVERRNGRFLHHDGGREDNPKRLAAILSRADAVVCPLDCVSHDAVNRLKRLCETNAKRLVMIPRASLASFARGLREVA